MIAVTWFIVSFVDALLANYLLPYAQQSSSKLDDTLFPLVKGLVNFALYAIAIIFIIQYLGYEVTGLLAGLGIGGLAFALAAQDVLSNFFGGAAVITDKPFKVGDRILLSGNDGFVRQIGMRSTTIETFDGTMIVVPNSTVASSVVENISAERARRVKVILGVEYGTSTKKMMMAKELLTQIVLDDKCTEDRSLVHFTAFGPSSLDIQLIYWIKDLDNILSTKDAINFAIKDAFEKHRISFAFPSQTVYVKK
jgi:MscS family membrane protein